MWSVGPLLKAWLWLEESSLCGPSHLRHAVLRQFCDHTCSAQAEIISNVNLPIRILMSMSHICIYIYMSIRISSNIICAVYLGYPRLRPY